MSAVPEGGEAAPYRSPARAHAGVLSYPLKERVGSAVFAALVLGGCVLGLVRFSWSAVPEELELMVMGASSFVVATILVVRRFRTRITYDEQGLHMRPPWTGPRTLRWSDVRTARWRRIAGWLSLSDGVTVVRVAPELTGKEDFAAACRAYLPSAAQSDPEVALVLTLFARGYVPTGATRETVREEHPAVPGMLAYGRNARRDAAAPLVAVLALAIASAFLRPRGPHAARAEAVAAICFTLLALAHGRRSLEAFFLRYAFDDEGIRVLFRGAAVQSLRWAEVRAVHWRGWRTSLELSDGSTTVRLSPQLLGLRAFAEKCRSRVPAALLASPDVAAALQLMEEGRSIDLAHGGVRAAARLRRDPPAQSGGGSA